MQYLTLSCSKTPAAFALCLDNEREQRGWETGQGAGCPSVRTKIQIPALMEKLFEPGTPALRGGIDGDPETESWVGFAGQPA